MAVRIDRTFSRLKVLWLAPLFSVPLAAAFIVAVAEPRPAHAGVCQCLDLADLKQRQQQVKVAIKTYEQEIQKMAFQMMSDRKTLDYTAARRQILQGRVQDALNQAALGHLSTGATGETDNLCNTTVSDKGTPCMQESIRRHEQVHRDACLRTQTPGSIATGVAEPGKFKDRFEVQHEVMTTYAAEEIMAYSIEQGFLDQEIASLDEPCHRPPPVQRDYTSQPRSPGPARKY